MAYWPPPQLTPDTRTITFSLAIDSTTAENGCLNFVPGSQRARKVRPFKAQFAGGREEGHAVVSELYLAGDKAAGEGKSGGGGSDDDGDDSEKYTDVISPTPVRRGSVSIHDEVSEPFAHYSSFARVKYADASCLCGRHLFCPSKFVFVNG